MKENNNKTEEKLENISNANSQNQKKSKAKISIIIIFIILFLFSGFFALKFFQNKNKEPYWFDNLAKDGILEGRTPNEIQSLLNQVVEEGMFNISINPDPIFENGKAEGNIAIENIPANHYYTKVLITLNETGEVIFKSGGLKPGQYIEKIKLDKNLKKGDYPATAVFEITYPETLETIGSVAADITIHVLN